MTYNSFVFWPYFSGAVFVTGALLRYAMTSPRSETFKAELFEGWSIFRGSRLWRLSLVIVLAAHVVAFLAPRAVVRWNSVAARLYLLEGFLFFAGCIALLGGALVVWNYLGRSNLTLVSSIFDTVFLAFLMVSLASGLLLAVFYRWGSSWGAVILDPYLSSLLRGEPVVDLVAQMPFLAQLHVLSSFAAVAVLPLTRAAILLVAPAHLCVTFASRLGSRAFGAAEAWIRQHDPGAWVWPEED